jgi:ESCO1/2 acetyl-transferase
VKSSQCVALNKDSDITKTYTPTNTKSIHNGDYKLLDGSDYSEDECKIGVRVIWTKKGFRLRCVASKLIDNVRRFFYYSKIAVHSDLAFSQPTSCGLKFAIAYCKTDHIWGYS